MLWLKSFCYKSQKPTSNKPRVKLIGGVQQQHLLKSKKRPRDPEFKKERNKVGISRARVWGLFFWSLVSCISPLSLPICIVSIPIPEKEALRGSVWVTCCRHLWLGEQSIIIEPWFPGVHGYVYVHVCFVQTCFYVCEKGCSGGDGYSQGSVAGLTSLNVFSTQTFVPEGQKLSFSLYFKAIAPRPLPFSGFWYPNQKLHK